MKAVPSFLLFNGRMGRLPYIVATVAVFALQYGLVWLAFHQAKLAVPMDWRFWVMPLRSFADLDGSGLSTLLALALSLLAAWVLASLSFRRANDANASPWAAAFSIAPIVQLSVILLLWFAPTRLGTEDTATRSAEDPISSWATVYGVLGGAALTVLAVALGALVFGVYEPGLVVRFGYRWADQPNATKDRPCCIILVTESR